MIGKDSSRNVLIVFFFFLVFIVKAQEEVDTIKINQKIIQLINFHEKNVDSAMLIANELEKLIPNLNSTKKNVQLKYKIQNQIAITYAIKGNYIKAFEFFKKNTEIDTIYLTYHELGTAFNNLAITYMNFGNYSKSIENYIISLKYRELTGVKSEIAASYLNIGLCYYRQNMFEESLKYYQNAEKNYYDLEKESPALATKIYNNVGLIYLNQSKLDLAEDYFEKALKIEYENNLKSQLANTYNYYSEIFAIKKNIPKAIELSYKALELNQELKSDYGKNLTFINLGKYYAKLKNYEKSINYLDSSLFFFKLQNDLWEIKDIYEILAENYTAQEKHKLASLYKDSIIHIKDSIFSKESITQQKNTEALYETEKKENEIKLLNKNRELDQAKIKEQQLIEIGLAVGSIFLFIFLLFVFKQLQVVKKQKEIIAETNEELNQTNEEISAQRDQIEHQKHKIEHAHNEVKASINYAERIQTALLDNKEHWDSISEHFILFKPRDVVSGDFYWAYSFSNVIAREAKQSVHLKNDVTLSLSKSKSEELSVLRQAQDDNSELVIWAAADCTGHGVPGAFMSMLGVSFLNEIVVEGGETNPGKILDKLRAKIIKTLEQKSSDEERKDGMDIALCVWNKQTNILQYAGANNPLVIVRSIVRHSALDAESHSNWETLKQAQDERIIEIKADKMPIGKYVNDLKPFTTHEIQLQKGDIIYTFTDGFQDQFGGAEGKKYMVKRMKKYLSGMNEVPLSRQRELLNEEFVQWMEVGETEQIDDVCVVGVKI